jgi:sec-independent protein translocase protein TatA
MPIHPLWIVVILVVVLIIFGPGRLPELGAGLGKAMREFRKATSEITSDVTAATQSKPEPASTTTSDKSSTPETKPTGT